MKVLKKISDRLFSTSAAGLYLILFAIAIGAATFIENDFGTPAAQKVVYRARWFEVLLLLFAGSLIANIIRFRMIEQKKWSIFTFHAAILIIIAGAAITRYAGSEGMMHIREGSETNLILSNETYLQFEVKQGEQIYRFDEEVFFASLGKNRFDESYQIGGELINISLDEFIPNPVEKLVTGSEGQPTLKIVIAGAEGRKDYLLKEGTKLNIEGTVFSFMDQPGEEDDVRISFKDDLLNISSADPLVKMQMSTQQLDTLAPGVEHPLQLLSLHNLNGLRFVPSEFRANATTAVTSSSPKMGNGSIAMARLKVNIDGQEAYLPLKGSQGMNGQPESVTIDGTTITAAYGSKYWQLPFSIRLRDFIMERYPGTNSASSYASEVTLIDPRNDLKKDKRIYMNNILNYNGYRFFQSSYDRDEGGTILSVNHDAMGTWVSYLGYFLLTLGMILTLMSKRTRFHHISTKLKDMRLSPQMRSLTIPLLMLLALGQTMANNAPSQIIDEHHAEKFSSIVIQDYRGRMKPVHTLASEVIRKLAHKESLYDQQPTQILIGMMLYPDQWANTPLIRLGKHEALRQMVPVDGKLACYNDFFKPEYILKDAVQEAYNMEPRFRGNLEKELIKVDERVNILNMIFTGRLIRLFPQSKGSDTWLSLADAQHSGHMNTIDTFARAFVPGYALAVQSAMQQGNWQIANEMLDELCQYQHKYGSELLPSDRKIKAEIWLNKMNVFSNVGRMYALAGLGILLAFFVLVFNPSVSQKWPLRISLGLLVLLFLYHTMGLGIRWYVSGRAPWSNGYESMIYIGWTTMLAGMIFTRKSLGGLAATSILASTILMVAGLSWMDPEITPLVPVLRSYWLTIHVSLVAGSYGFLMLGAIIGILNLILMVFTRPNNKVRVTSKVKELTYISELTLIGGLFMLSVGTYLGGVWANESWGRYWGWDAKETWALVTILVYSFILHMRFIPGFRGNYAFNVASLFGLASVMMTYFGVNYYLSGLHSYAAGDPVPIPSFVYYTVGALVILSTAAYFRKRQLKLRV